MKKLIIALTLIVSSHCYSASMVWMGLGTTTQNFLTAQDNIKGGTVYFDVAPTIFAGLNLPFIFAGSNLLPAIGYAHFFTDDNTTKSDLILQLHANQELLTSFYFHYGFSSYMEKIGGDGSDVRLNNGNGYSTFYAPKNSMTTYTSSLDFGGEYIYDANYTFKMNFSIMRFLSSDRRRVGHTMTLNYFF